MNTQQIKRSVPQASVKKDSGRSLLMCWDEFVSKWLRTGKSRETIKSVQDAILLIIRHTKIRTIEDCNNPRLLEEELFRLKKERNWSNVTFNTRLKNLSTYFRWLEAYEYISENKLKKIPRCKMVPKEQHYLTHEEVLQIASHAERRNQSRFEAYRNKLFVEIIAYTGARRCEILNIKTKHIKYIKGIHQLSIQGKKQKGRIRYYNLPNHVIRAYEEYTEYRALMGRQDEEYLFLSRKHGQRWTSNGVRKFIENISRELGFKITCHSFRRYVATYLHRKGAAIEEIKYHLGHSRISTTELYIARTGHLTAKTSAIMSNLRGEGL